MLYNFLEMKKYLIPFILLIVTASAKSQDVFNRPQPPTAYTEDLRTINIMQDIVNRGGNPNNFTVEQKYVGSPFQSEEYKPGSVYLNGQKKGDFMLRYNVFAEVFEIQTLSNEKDATDLVHKNTNISVVMDGKRYVYKYYLADGVQQFGYFEVVKELEKVTLLKKQRKLIQEGKAAKTSFDINRPSRLIDKEGYYIALKNGKIIEIKQNNKALAKIFDEYNIDLLKYLNDNNLNVKNTGDLELAVAYVNDNLN